MPAAGRAPRIALSGSAGTGKSTLGRALAERAGVPFIEEGHATCLARGRGLDLHTLSRDGLGELIVELWDEQQQRERECARGFVADRSSIDFAAFWLHYGLYYDEKATRAFIERMVAASASYDRIALCPWRESTPGDGVRSTNPWVQLRFQTVLEGLLERHVPARRILRVPPIRGDFAERLEAVTQLL